MHVPPLGCVCERELLTGLVMNSSSFLSKLGYVVVSGSLFPVYKLIRTTKLVLYSQLLRRLNLQLPNLWFGSIIRLKAAAFSFFFK